MTLDILIQSTMETMEDLVPQEVAHDIHKRVYDFLDTTIRERNIDSAIYHSAIFQENYSQLCSMEVDRYLKALNSSYEVEDEEETNTYIKGYN